MNTFKRKVQNAWLRLKFEMSGGHVHHLVDSLIDLKVSGKVLVKYMPTIKPINDKGEGYTNTVQTHYAVLNHVFKNVSLCKDDNFIDVGCGKGRILAYMINKGFLPFSSITGIEISENAYKIAKEWTKKYDGLNVLQANALEFDYNPYTVMFLYRPFYRETFKEFVAQVERTVKHPIKMIYLCDSESKDVIENRSGWDLLYQDSITKLYGCIVTYGSLDYSIWQYTPVPSKS